MQKQSQLPTFIFQCGKTTSIKKKAIAFLPAIFLLLTIILSSCASPQATRIMEVTAYCDCSLCCNWQRGSKKWLRLDFWNRYVNKGPAKGRPYSGLTASGTVPRIPEEGFFSLDSIYRPWTIPYRLVLFPWHFLPHDGTIAADTSYYPFGTRMFISGYGWGVVQDRGGAIKGPDRIDLFFNSHQEALIWGRKKVQVAIEKQ